MRVVVHHPARTEVREDGETVEVPESVAAYRMGRIQDFVNPLTGETTPADDVAQALLVQAQEEHPGLTVTLERLEQDDTSSEDPKDHTSKWVPAELFNPERAAPNGAISAHAMQATQEQATS